MNIVSVAHPSSKKQRCLGLTLPPTTTALSAYADFGLARALEVVVVLLMVLPASWKAIA
jgi:hypothetical protein